ncbi:MULTISPECIES: DUF86 domain-containing protein [Bacillaceae]|uniref:Uncharacterized protein YutE (UPF0331/DUF86 family) n=1 Tax=Peribacillus huizhouensis TaxID=1501239 RepID=A0ABR6CPE4_9BACI|nr:MULTISPECIES: DUF86 domain-containing protein [Bacillaceae]MBA9026903.1 uncharacterized protein YutE (UPF0331/DUF86 family) [Peribacillus huizhouensis]
MYFVDRQQIEKHLLHLEQRLRIFEEQSNWDNELASLALCRLVQTSIDAMLDTGNAIIDGFIMRDPGSYEDIVDILLDEKVIDEKMAHQFKHILPLRKMLVQDYLVADTKTVATVFSENIQAFIEYPKVVRNYLINELGPVSAFKN